MQDTIIKSKFFEKIFDKELKQIIWDRLQKSNARYQFVYTNCLAPLALIEKMFNRKENRKSE